MPQGSPQSKLLCRMATGADAKAWDAFVDSRPEGRLGHVFGFGTLQERTYSLPTVRIIASIRDGEGREQIHGVAQGSLVTIPFRERRLLSMPFHEYGGALGATPEARSALLGEFRTVAASLGVAELELKGVECPTEAALTARREFVRVRLTRKEEMYRDVFASPLRRSISKAARCGVTVERLGNWQRVETEFLPLYRLGLRRIGGFPHRSGFFRNVWEILGSRAQFWVASREGVPLVAMTAYTIGSTIHVVDLLRRYAGDEFGAGDAIHWEIMQAALSDRLETFDFGPAGGGGTLRYKLKWGGEIQYGCDLRIPAAEQATVELLRSRAPTPGNARVPTPFRRSLRAAASGAFRRLPEPLWLTLGSEVRRWMLR